MAKFPSYKAKIRGRRWTTGKGKNKVDMTVEYNDEGNVADSTVVIIRHGEDGQDRRYKLEKA